MAEDLSKDPGNPGIVAGLLRERAALSGGEGYADRLKLIEAELAARGHKDAAPEPARPAARDESAGRDARHTPPQGRREPPSSKA